MASRPRAVHGQSLHAAASASGRKGGRQGDARRTEYFFRLLEQGLDQFRREDRRRVQDLTDRPKAAGGHVTLVSWDPRDHDARQSLAARLDPNPTPRLDLACDFLRNDVVEEAIDGQGERHAGDLGLIRSALIGKEAPQHGRSVPAGRNGRVVPGGSNGENGGAGRAGGPRAVPPHR